MLETIATEQHLVVVDRCIAFIHTDELVQPRMAGKHVIGFNEVFNWQLPVGLDIEFQRLAELYLIEIVALELTRNRCYAGGKIIGAAAQVDEYPVVPAANRECDWVEPRPGMTVARIGDALAPRTVEEAALEAWQLARRL